MTWKPVRLSLWKIKSRIRVMFAARLLRRFLGIRVPIVVLILVLVMVFLVMRQPHHTEKRQVKHEHHDSELVNRKQLQNHIDRPVKAEQTWTKGKEKTRQYVTFDRDVPIIWVGGVPRSGTTLARAMLDAHPDIRCGEETRVIPRILGIHKGMMGSQKEAARLNDAKITNKVLNDAMGAYILSIISQHGETAPRLCNKDPFTLRSINKLMEIFPNSKFILMVRDGRATCHSIISRKVSIRGFDFKTFKGCLKDWNKAMEDMFSKCLQQGQATCMPVRYENVVMHTNKTMQAVLRFVNVPWSTLVLHHEQTIGKKNGVSLSQRELSTDQVNKPVNTDALSKWVGEIPGDVLKDMEQIAPMLQRLGYDPNANPPNYGESDLKFPAWPKHHGDVDTHDDSLRFERDSRP